MKIGNYKRRFDMGEENKINASPTKEFFISMIVKDISLEDAIAELIDNSVDGALKIRGGSSLKGLVINVSFDKDEFKINDNCGGIDVDTARNRAFRFGATEENVGSRPTNGIGRFGVGMKRSIFKMGEFFSVESITTESKFIVNVDVPEWAKNKDHWDFYFNEVNENRQIQSGEEAGTTISVSRLYNGVSSQLALENFNTDLIRRIELHHQYHLNNGLTININGYTLKSKPSELLQSDEIFPAVIETTYPFDDGKVFVKIISGVAEPDPKKAGWYVFCNGRMILEANQTTITGWSDGVRKYHNQYARFRGFVFFQSENVSLLPWNTTKTGVDLNSPLYTATRQEMLNAMRPVLEFLNEIAKEKKQLDEGETAPLERKLKMANHIAVSTYKTPQLFRAPESAVVVGQRDELIRISYTRPKEQIDKVRNQLGGRVTNKEIGEATFNYFLTMECED
jgi:hypothetical protein